MFTFPTLRDYLPLFPDSVTVILTACCVTKHSACDLIAVIRMEFNCDITYYTRGPL